MTPLAVAIPHILDVETTPWALLDAFPGDGYASFGSLSRLSTRGILHNLLGSSMVILRTSAAEMAWPIELDRRRAVDQIIAPRFGAGNPPAEQRAIYLFSPLSFSS